jgi:medium-chain acyl-[acyl-carrier-protein] hydrolase
MMGMVMVGSDTALIGTEGRPDARGSWLKYATDAEKAPIRLLCFPHAGAGASSFNSWLTHLPSDIGLVKAQLPGREDNAARPPFTRMEDLIPDLFRQAAPLLDRPLAIYGHSMGALVAFELTRELRRRGHRPPVALFVSGRRAPHKPLRRILLHRLSDIDLVEHLRNMGGTSIALLEKPKWRQRFLPTMRADLQLSDIYAYGAEPPLACPLHVFLGETDHEMHREDWEAWSEQAAGEFSRCLLPGGHIFSQPAQAVLVRRIVAIVATKPAGRASEPARSVVD